MNEKQVFQALVVMVLLASVASTAALAGHGQDGWDRLDPQENDGRDEGQTYGNPYTGYREPSGEHWVDGPGNFTDENWNGVPLDTYFTLWSLDRDDERSREQRNFTDRGDPPEGPGRYTGSGEWIRNNYASNDSEAARVRHFYVISNHSDVGFAEPPHDTVRTYNENDFDEVPTNRFNYSNTTYIPEGIRQIDSTDDFSFGTYTIELGSEKSENHAAGGPEYSADPSGENNGACRTFPDRDEDIDNGSHERVTVYNGEDPEKNDTHCWIEAAYVDEHSVDGLVILHEAYTDLPGRIEEPRTYPEHPLNDSTPQQEDNQDGIRRFVSDNGTARAVADFRFNATDTYDDADEYYPDSEDEAEFQDPEEKERKEWWRNPNDPEVEWTRLVNSEDCPVPSEQSSTPDCQLAINSSNTHAPVLNYSVDPSGGSTATGSYVVGEERIFKYETKFRTEIEHWTLECEVVDDDPEDRDETVITDPEFDCIDSNSPPPGPDSTRLPVLEVETVNLDYIAEDKTYVHAQDLDEEDVSGEDGIQEFDAALYENGDRAIHFATDEEPWRRVGLHGSEFGLSGGFSFYTTRNQDYDQFTRYAYPTKYTTYERNVTGYHRQTEEQSTVTRGQRAYSEDAEDFGDDLRQNSTVTPLVMHGFPTAAGIRPSPDSQSEVTGKIVLTEPGFNGTAAYPPTAITTDSKDNYVNIDRELPEERNEYSRGTEVAFRYNRSVIREEMQVDTPYGYADDAFTSPSYDEHNITITGMPTNETRKLNVSSELSDDRSKDTINKTTLTSEVVNQNREENTVTVEFKLTTSNGPVNMEEYEDECSEDDGIGKIVVPRKGMSDDEFQTRHDNGTVRYTFNKSNIPGDALNARYEPVDWWEVPQDCYPMHEPSSTSTIIKSAPLFTGVIRQVIGFILALAILSYAFNTVVVAAGGERPEETFFSWLVSEVYDAIRGWLR